MVSDKGAAMESLKAHFSQYGEIASVFVPYTIKQKMTKGYAFVNFKEQAGHDKAITKKHTVRLHMHYP